MSFTSLLGEFRRSRAKPKPLNSLLAIEIGDRTMSAALLRRRGAAMRVEKFAQTALALDPLSSEAALVGREMQNFLEREGLREKRCLVCAPIGWTLTTRMELPDLPEADKLNMMKLHAEREMPFGLEDIRLGVSRYRTLEGNTGATLAGMPNTRLNALLAGLKAAGLKPLSVTLGAAALALGGATATAGRLVLVGDSKGLDMAVASGGGVVVLRRLEDTLAAYGQTSGLDSRSMGRQLRIAMGELPDAVRADVRGVSVYGERAISEPLLEEARRVLSQMGLQVESALADAVRWRS